MLRINPQPSDVHTNSNADAVPAIVSDPPMDAHQDAYEDEFFDLIRRWSKLSDQTKRAVLDAATSEQQS